MKTKIKIILLATVVVMICSCSPERRLERLIRHHPELVTTDTVSLHDTIITRESKADTALSLAALVPGVIIQNDRLEIGLTKVHDTLYLKGRCRPDTIIRKIEVPLERIRIINSGTSASHTAKMPWILTLIICLVGVIGFIVNRIKK
jgi:hypothetical protein